MKRRTFRLWSAVSLLLCMTACAMWAQSYTRADTFIHNGYRLRQLTLADGGMYFQSIGFVRREGEWAEPQPLVPPPPPRPPLKPPPGYRPLSMTPPPLTTYKETPDSYIGWLKTFPVSYRQKRWRWTHEFAGRPPTELLTSFDSKGNRLPSPRSPLWPQTERVTRGIVRKLSRHPTKVDDAAYRHYRVDDDLLTGRTIWVPFWPLVALTALLPAAQLRAAWADRRRARRRAAGLCPRCGYDLRGTPRGCPECGTTADATEGDTCVAPTAAPTPPPASPSARR